MPYPAPRNWDRKQFLSAAIAVSALSVLPARLWARNPMTIQQVIDLITKNIPGAPFKQTVDTIKAGDPNQPVTGIVTTMFATIEVIEAAAKKGANFIIAHEPTFYNHADDTKWLDTDPTYQYKIALLNKHRITVWRCHDYHHAFKPDGVMTGVLKTLGWEQYRNTDQPYLITIPSISLRSVIALAKEKMKIDHVRYIGDLSQACSRISLIPGAAGGRMQINTVSTVKPDLLIIGELEEWETSEYIRDLRASGGKTALLVLGHVVSEEPGLEWLKQWLQPQLAGIEVTHIPSHDAFQWA